YDTKTLPATDSTISSLLFFTDLSRRTIPVRGLANLVLFNKIIVKMKKLKKQIIFLISLVCLATLQVSMTSAYLRFSTPNILHDFEGFYRFPNRVAYIQFEVIDKQLTAKQVWDGRQYPLTLTGDLTFESNEERYKVAFDAIQPTAVEILNRVTLTKIDFDPTKRQTLSP